MKKFSTTISTCATVLAAMIIMAPAAYGYVASSTNYRVQSDSVNVGGTLSTSASYRAEDTLGEEGVGTSSSATYNIKAGYQQMQQVYLAISIPGNISLAPNITTSGGTANGSATWTVTTDNAAGYTMNIRASGTPALQLGINSFANYITAGGDPDFAFSTPAAASRFGYSPEGTNILQRFKDNGVTCNAGALDTASACWVPLQVAPDTIVTRSSPNHPSGTPTTIRFRAESGASNTQPAGSYTATSTLTVLAL